MFALIYDCIFILVRINLSKLSFPLQIWLVLVMLTSLIQNSNRLIKSQFSENKQILGEMIRIKNKNKRINISIDQQGFTSKVFKDPNFDLKVRKGSPKFKFSSEAKDISKSYRVRSSTQKVKKNEKKRNYSNTIQFDRKINPEDTLDLGLNCSISNNDKIIHSRKNNRCPISNKNPKVHHSRIYQTKKTNRFKKSLIQQPGFVNLIFYKNSLEQMESIRTARTSHRKQHLPKTQTKTAATKNRIKFVKLSQLQSDPNECRPWSPLLNEPQEHSNYQLHSQLHSLRI